jgi:hypothetical protein
MAKAVKDVTGVIKKITQPASKTFTAKRGKNVGNEFTIFSIGVMLDDGNYYNIKGKTEEEVLKYLYCLKFTRNFAVGDEVKIYLEAEDDEQKYWRIVSITPLNPMENIPIEDLSGDLKDEDSTLDEATKEANKQHNVNPVVTPPKAASPIPKPEPIKDIQKVNDYKAADADKYELGMSKNACAILVASLMQGKTCDDLLMVLQDEKYSQIVEALYNKGKEIRKKLLGY